MANKFFRNESMFKNWLECETPTGRMRFERETMNTWRAYTLPGYLLANTIYCSHKQPRPFALYKIYIALGGTQ